VDDGSTDETACTLSALEMPYDLRTVVVAHPDRAKPVLAPRRPRSHRALRRAVPDHLRRPRSGGASTDIGDSIPLCRGDRVRPQRPSSGPTPVLAIPRAWGDRRRPAVPKIPAVARWGGDRGAQRPDQAKRPTGDHGQEAGEARIGPAHDDRADRACHSGRRAGGSGRPALILCLP